MCKTFVVYFLRIKNIYLNLKKIIKLNKIVKLKENTRIVRFSSNENQLLAEVRK